jgi:ATP-dependent DNA ligase
MLSDEVRSWRPQGFALRVSGTIENPIVEPHWDGIRVLAFIELDRPAMIIDERGNDVSAANEPITAALSRAARAETLVVDGYLSSQPTRSGIGTAVGATEIPTVGASMQQLLVGRRRKTRFDEDEPPARVVPHDRDELVAFVAVDLLYVDDQELLEIPLLERKRILDSALEEEDLVRLTPFVRPPIDVWVGSWRSLGFRNLAIKAANSRYVPGEPSENWESQRIPTR